MRNVTSILTNELFQGINGILRRGLYTVFATILKPSFKWVRSIWRNITLTLTNPLLWNMCNFKCVYFALLIFFQLLSFMDQCTITIWYLAISTHLGIQGDQYFVISTMKKSNPLAEQFPISDTLKKEWI